MPMRAWGHGLIGLLDVWRSSGKPSIHVNGRRGNSVAFAARLNVRGFRFVTTVHGVLGLHDRRNLIYRLVDLAAGRAARAVIAVSADTRRRLVAAGSPAGRTFAIGNGLAASDLDDLRRVAATRAGSTLGDQLRIGFLGRLSPEKGTTELVTVARPVCGGCEGGARDRRGRARSRLDEACDRGAGRSGAYPLVRNSLRRRRIPPGRGRANHAFAQRGFPVRPARGDGCGLCRRGIRRRRDPGGRYRSFTRGRRGSARRERYG